MGIFHLALLISSMLFLTLMCATLLAHAQRRGREAAAGVGSEHVDRP